MVKGAGGWAVDRSIMVKGAGGWAVDRSIMVKGETVSHPPPRSRRDWRRRWWPLSGDSRCGAAG